MENKNDMNRDKDSDDLGGLGWEILSSTMILLLFEVPVVVSTLYFASLKSEMPSMKENLPD